MTTPITRILFITGALTLLHHFTLAAGPEFSGPGMTPASAPAVGGQASGADDQSGRIMIPAIPGVPKIFLPDIGIAGDFAFERNNLSKTDPRYSAHKQQPRIRDGQVVFFSPIDPYTNAQFTVDLPEEGNANIEEAWIYFNKLPGNTSARLGRFLPEFGLLDLLNTFQLPMVDRPSAISNYLSSDGLIGTGASLNVYVPNPWDLNLKADFSALRGNLLGASENTLDLTYLSTLDYSRDVFNSGSFETGVSVAQGPSPVGRSETLVEPYMQLQYAPTQRRIWTWSAEGMLAERHGQDAQNNTQGFYTFLDYNFNLRYHVGFLVDLADQAVAPYGKQLGLAPNVTWFLSDNLRFRAQYTHTTALDTMRSEEKISLQATFALGNLKQLD